MPDGLSGLEQVERRGGDLRLIPQRSDVVQHVEGSSCVAITRSFFDDEIRDRRVGQIQCGDRQPAPSSNETQTA